MKYTYLEGRGITSALRIFVSEKKKWEDAAWLLQMQGRRVMNPQTSALAARITFHKTEASAAWVAQTAGGMLPSVQGGSVKTWQDRLITTGHSYR